LARHTSPRLCGSSEYKKNGGRLASRPYVGGQGRLSGTSMTLDNNHACFYPMKVNVGRVAMRPQVKQKNAEPP
jgi:hypothetical protein